VTSEEDEEELLKQAILMSLTADNAAMESQPTGDPEPEIKNDAGATAQEKDKMDTQPEPKAVTEPKENVGLAAMNDPAFVNDILKTLPGVDVNDPQIKSILAEMGGHAGAEDADLEQALKMSMDIDKKDDDKKDEDKKEGQ